VIRTLISILFLAAAATAHAGVVAKVGDVTQLKGQGVNYLTGMGLVVGLAGTGDGDDYATAMRPLAKALEFYANPVASMDELKDTKNVAIVFVEAVLPENGAREGSRIDVKISSFGAAKSLEGGRLLPLPLLYPDRNVNTVFAIAAGGISLDDADNPTTGTIQDGAVIQEDVIHSFLSRGREVGFTSPWIQPDAQYVTLVVDDEQASWTLAREIAQALDSALALMADVDRVALAVDPKNVIVLVPPSELNSPADWIYQIEDADLLIAQGEARVVVNRKTGSIVVSGNAKISPVVVSHQGLTITVTGVDADGNQQVVDPVEQGFVGLDPSGSGGSNVSELLEALNRLNVPIDDRIAILTQVHSMGALHAKLMVRD
jgi:flagellar P-ring protein precursor FlgI